MTATAAEIRDDLDSIANGAGAFTGLDPAVRTGLKDRIWTFIGSAIVNVELKALGDVAATAPGSGDVLTWNGSVWAPQAPSGGGGDLDDLGDVDTTGKADGDVLTWDAGGGEWIAAPSSGSGAPTTASYVVLGTNATLTAERVLTGGTGIGLTDGGAGSTLTVAISDAELLAIAGLTSAADRLPYFTGSGTAALATFSAFARTLVDDADASAARSTLGVAIGSDVAAYDAGLASLATVDTAADLLPYTTAANTWGATALTSFARGLLDDTDASGARSTLGVYGGPLSPPTTATFADASVGVAAAWVNASDGSGVLLRANTVVGVDLKFKGKSVSGNFDHKMKMSLLVPNATNPSGGIALYDGTKLYVFGYRSNSNAIQVLTYATATSVGTQVASMAYKEFQELWFRIADDGTDLKFYFAIDDRYGADSWVEVYSIPRTTFMASGPTHIGPVANNNNGTNPLIVVVRSFS